MESRREREIEGRRYRLREQSDRGKEKIRERISSKKVEQRNQNQERDLGEKKLKCN